MSIVKNLIFFLKEITELDLSNKYSDLPGKYPNKKLCLIYALILELLILATAHGSIRIS